ncbi:MAG: hypothetical protein ACKVQR_06000 [Aquabacterium sp.]
MSPQNLAAWRVRWPAVVGGLLLLGSGWMAGVMLPALKGDVQALEAELDQRSRARRGAAPAVSDGAQAYLDAVPATQRRQERLGAMLQVAQQQGLRVRRAEIGAGNEAAGADLAGPEGVLRWDLVALSAEGSHAAIRRTLRAWEQVDRFSAPAGLRLQRESEFVDRWQLDMRLLMLARDGSARTAP